MRRAKFEAWPMAIKACEAWPRQPGVAHTAYAVAFTDTDYDEVALLRVYDRLDRTNTAMDYSWPSVPFDPCGGVERGTPVLSRNVIAAERIGDHTFSRALLDMVRAAYPGVRWQVHTVHNERTASRNDGRHITLAYGCLNHELVGVVAEYVFGDPESDDEPDADEE